MKKHKQTFIGKVIIYFPTLHILLLLIDLAIFASSPHIIHLFVFLFLLYLFPVISFRIHNFFFPLKRMITRIPSGKYPPWWGSFQFQRIFISVPFLEAILRLFPEVFNIWLRLWGSKIGKSVYWNAHVEIADRSLLEIGDYTFIGHRCGFYCHTVSPAKDGRLILFVKGIKIGSKVFIGSGSRLGPGVVVSDSTMLPILTDLYLNQTEKNSREQKA